MKCTLASSLLFPLVVLAAQTSIYFGGYPGYVNLRFCARECMDGIGAAAAAVRNNVICSTNECLCGHGQEALNYIQSCALSRCSSVTQDATSATSIFIGYCSSYSGVFTPELLPATSLSVTFASYPGYGNLRFCVRECLGGIGAAAAAVQNNLGCDTNECLCNHISQGIDYVSSCALSRCSTITQDLFSATSVMNGYCDQYHGTGVVSAVSVKPITFSTYPGYSNLIFCAQECLGGIGAAAAAVANNIGCTTDDCLCNHQDLAIAYVQSCAALRCSSVAGDISSARSVMSGYCGNYRAVVITQAATPSTATGAFPGPSRTTSTAFLTQTPTRIGPSQTATASNGNNTI
jgi:hypothetical protein